MSAPSVRVGGQSGAGMLAGWGNAPALIHPRGNPPSACAQRLAALRRNLVLLEETPSETAWHRAEVADAEARLRDQAVWIIGHQAA